MNSHPKLTCTDQCKNTNYECAGNNYFNPHSKSGTYSHQYSVCRPTDPTTGPTDKKACEDAKAKNYMTCPSKHEAKAHYQSHDGCFFTCEKSSGGISWVMIVAIIAAVIGVMLLLFMLFHHKS